MIDLEKLQSFRFSDNPQNGVNTLHGLYDLIVENLNENSIVAEIGCWRGVSSELFAMHSKELYCIDPWVTYNEQEEEEAVKKAEEEFDERMKPFKHVLKMKMKSEDAFKFLKDNSLDLLYIDGDHSFNAVNADITYWKSKVKTTGCLCGHDYNLDDVQHAVNKHFFNIPVILYKDSSWCIKMKDYYEQHK